MTEGLYSSDMNTFLSAADAQSMAGWQVVCLILAIVAMVGSVVLAFRLAGGSGPRRNTDGEGASEISVEPSDGGGDGGD
jgi:hypothetical protein